MTRMMGPAECGGLGMLLVVIAALACPGAARAARQETGFLDRVLRLGGSRYRYQVYLPVNFDIDRKWPVVLFLHGAGERGADGLRPTQTGLAPAIRWDAIRFPALAVFPQAPNDSTWLGEPGEAALAALDATIEEFSGDRDRVILTGISMGGYGAWDLAFRHPDLFAAIVPLCGGIVPPEGVHAVRLSPAVAGQADPYGFVAARLTRLPVWVFHGAKDTSIPVTESRRMVEALKRAGAYVKYTEYPDAGHDCWTAAYGDPELWTWALEQRRK